MTNKIIFRLRAAAEYIREINPILHKMNIKLTVECEGISILGTYTTQYSDSTGEIKTSTRTITWECIETVVLNPVIIEIVKVMEDLMPTGVDLQGTDK